MRWLLFSLFLVLGCSAIVSPDDGRLGGGGPGTDSGFSDTGPPIVLMDSGAVRDAGDSMTTTPPPDTSVDTSGPCTGDDRCVGDTLVRCESGTAVATDCQSMDAFCEDGRCEEWNCTPGQARCGENAVFVCDARGVDETRVDCPFGCDEDDAMCRPMPMICPGIPPLAPGARVMVDTCGNGDDSTYQRTSDGGGCPTATRANGPDLVYAITLATRSTITLDLRDDDGVPIDTVLYLRTHCDEMASQVACSDDLPCGATDFGCGGGSTSRLEVRQSRITITLDPGIYYVIADSFEYETGGGTRFTCGDVLLRYDVVATSVMP